MNSFRTSLSNVRFVVDFDLLILLVLVWCNLVYFGEEVFCLGIRLLSVICVVEFGIIVSNLVLTMFYSVRLAVIFFVLGSWCGW